MNKEEIVSHVMGIWKLEPSLHTVEDFVRLAVNMAYTQGSVDRANEFEKILNKESINEKK